MGITSPSPRTRLLHPQSHRTSPQDPSGSARRAAPRQRPARRLSERALLVQSLESRTLLSVTNGSFEDDLTGWSAQVPSGGFAVTAASHTAQPGAEVVYSPTDGANFALLKTNGPGSYTTVTQVLTVEAGDKISGWAFFDTTDNPSFNDNAQVYIREGDGAGAVAATVFSANVASVGTQGQTPWRYWQHTFATAGQYAVQAQVANAGDGVADSYMGLDAVGLNDEFPPPGPNAAPVVSAGGPYTVTEGQGIQLNGSASDPDADALSYGWDLDGNGTFNDLVGPRPSVSWSQLQFFGLDDGPMARTITFRVDDGNGHVVTAESTLTVNNAPPALVTISGPLTVSTNQTVSYTGSASDPAGAKDPLTYTWTVTRNGTPVGSPHVGQTFLFTPTQSGTHVVSLSVSDGDGGVTTSQRNVNVVTNNPPTANANGPYTTSEGNGVFLNGAGTDPDGDFLNYAWDLDGNGTFETSGQRPSVSYTTLRQLGLGDGPTGRDIRLRVTDSRGLSTISAPTRLTVNNTPPSNVQITGPTGRNIGETASYSGSAFDPAGTLDPLTFTWVVTKDGSTVLTRTGTSFSFTPQQVGTYTVTLTVSDGDPGGTASRNLTLVVGNNTAPVANAGGPYSVAEGAALTLDGTKSTDPDGDPLSYSWDLDMNGSYEFFGATPVLPWSTISNYGINDGPGSRSIRLRVTDSRGATSTSVATVNISNTPPQDLAIYGPTTLKEGQTGYYQGSATDPAGPYDPLTFSWGVTKDGQTVVTAGGTQYFNFTPQDPGQYVITLYASDGDAVSSITLNVTAVPNAVPKIEELNVEPLEVYEGEFVIVDGRYSDADGVGYHGITIDWGDPGNVSSHTPGNPWQVMGVEFNEETGHSYFLLSGVTWQEGEALGRALGGHLVTINDAAENEWVWNIFGWYYGAHVIWIGINDIEQEGNFVWSSGQQSDFTDWYIAEPNDAVGGEDFGSMWSSFQGHWNDFGPGQGAAYAVVEVDQPYYFGLGPDQFVANGIYLDDPDSPDDTYTLAVTVSDDAGATDTEYRTVKVLNAAPKVSFTKNLLIDEGVGFNLPGSFSDSGFYDVMTATVDYGDGSGEQELYVDNFAWGPNKPFHLNHVYADNGTYTLKLRVWDDDGGETIHNVTVNVKNVAPSAGDLAVQPAAVDEGGSVTLSGVVRDATAADAHTVLIEWGDGQTSTINLAAGADPAFSATHTYADDPSGAAPDTYDVVVKVTDDDGGTWSNVTPPAGAVQWAEGEVANGHWYLSVLSPAGGIQPALHAASARGGHLVTILSAGEQQFLVDTFLQGADAHKVYWIGLSDADEEGVWRWNTGELAYHYWKHNPVYLTDEWGYYVYDENGNPIPVEYTGPTPTTEEEGYGNWFSGEPNDWGGNEDYAVLNWHRGTGIPPGTWNDEDQFEPSVRFAIVEFDLPFGPLKVTVNNVAPAASITDAPQTSPEGTAITLGSLVTDAGADQFTYQWSITKDGVAYESPEGNSPTDGLTFTPTDDGTYVVTLRVDDGDGGEAVVTATVVVTNVAPVVTALSGPAGAVRGQEVTYSAGYQDAGAADVLAPAWEVLGPGGELVAAGSQDNVTFTPTVSGTYTVRFTVTDDDGASATEERQLQVVVAMLQEEPEEGGAALMSLAASGASGASAAAAGAPRTVLYVGGSTGADFIQLVPGAEPGSVEVFVDGVSQGLFAPTAGLVVFAQSGDDRVHVASSILLPALLFGGAGNDHLDGANGGGSVIVGGDGDDRLLGGSGRDVLIGGRGADQLVGNAGDDVLVAGHTAHDGAPAALKAIAAAWRSTDATYAQRVEALGAGTAGYALRTAASSAGPATVFDDGAGDVADILTGSAGIDWFLTNGVADRVMDQNGEIVSGG